jgi:hypothetical protein
MSVPRAGVAISSPNGVTRFCRGSGASRGLQLRDRRAVEGHR